MNANQEDITQLIIKKISEEASSIKHQWANPCGTQTRHFFIDNLLPFSICNEIHSSFPRDGNGFFSRETFRERKRTSADLDSYPDILSAITYSIQDPRVINLISEITSISQLEPDPKLYAGGLSMMFKGDFLNPHLDNSHDLNRKKFRRLNLLYYVSPGWKEEFGGNLELWDQSVRQPKTLVAFQNRLVAMETNKLSWHSVSEVKVEEPRCCVSNYYFSNISPNLKGYFHVTSFMGRPEQKIRRIISVADNVSRNLISKITKLGRGRNRIKK
jgi:Rps23 Pro-64 3,4-dihydroxylase Tpa1-like proline 4-hydroxylase